MCATSMIVDHYADRWRRRLNFPGETFPTPSFWPGLQPYQPVSPPAVITREEFDRLRQDVADMKELVERAMEYDKKTGQPECEDAAKIAALQTIAGVLGIDISEVILKLKK